MKIVRIIARLNVGGPAIHVVHLTHEFRKRGHESLLVVGPVPETEGNMEYYAAKWGIPLIRVDELVRPVSPKKDLIALWKIYRLIRREKPQIVHTHTAKAGTLGRFAALLAGVPITIHTFHGNIFDGYFSPARTRLFLFIERMLAHFTDCIITVSRSQSEELIGKYKIGTPEKVEVVRLGIDLGAFQSVGEVNLDQARMQKDHELVIGWVGRFTEIKDPVFFVDLAAALKSAGTLTKFIMVGDGPLRPAVEARISERGLQGHIMLVGWQDNMAELYARIDLMVLTSLNEGTPVTMIESMATGRPFVAFDVGGMADLMSGMGRPCRGFNVFDNGVLVGPRDVCVFARAIDLLVRDPELRVRMGQAGKAFAFQNFSKERLAQDMEALYRKLTVSHAGAVPERVSSN
jgi:glycosyltransferase involved in cell wall biosynthesis